MKIIKVGAIWCKECLVMRPLWAEIEKERPDLKTEYFDADEHPEILERYGIKKIPEFIFLDDEGKEIGRLQGMQPKEKILQIIDGHNF